MSDLAAVAADILASPAFWGFVGVVVGGVITGLVSIKLETIRADKAAALDSAKRQDDRRLSHDEFQRRTLLELQDQVNALQRALFLIHRSDVAAAKTSGRWGGGQVAPEINEMEHVAGLAIATMKSRIADPAIRGHVEVLLQASATIISTNDEGVADRALLASAQSSAQIHELAGAAIQATFVRPGAG